MKDDIFIKNIEIENKNNRNIILKVKLTVNRTKNITHAVIFDEKKTIANIKGTKKVVSKVLTNYTLNIAGRDIIIYEY